MKRPNKPRKFRHGGRPRPNATLCQCHLVSSTSLSSEGLDKCVYAAYPQSAVDYHGHKITPYCHFMIDHSDWERTQVPARHQNSLLSRNPEVRGAAVESLKALGVIKSPPAPNPRPKPPWLQGREQVNKP